MSDEFKLRQVNVRLKLTEGEPLISQEQITSPDKAVRVMAEMLGQMDREYFCVVNLDNQKHPINFNIVSMGDTNKSLVPVQNVFKAAILSNASSVIAFHNHPGGSLTASIEDIDVTKNLIEAGKILNIPVDDHIIIGGGSLKSTSIRMQNPEMFGDRPKQNIHSMIQKNMALVAEQRKDAPTKAKAVGQEL